MQGNYSISENTVPLYKAYNVYENANQNWDQRMNKYEGTAPVDLDLQNNEYKNYKFSGGIGRHSNENKHHIESIQERLIRAQEIKGNLTLNNANFYGNSWKTPALEMKFKQLHGGATA